MDEVCIKAFDLKYVNYVFLLFLHINLSFVANFCQLQLWLTFCFAAKIRLNLLFHNLLFLVFN